MGFLKTFKNVGVFNFQLSVKMTLIVVSGTYVCTYVVHGTWYSMWYAQYVVHGRVRGV